MVHSEFIDKSVFFPDQGILVIGDLHIGYESMLRHSGILVPKRQVKEIISDFEKIFKIIKEKNNQIKKIVFLGDIKHAFSFSYDEKYEFQEVLDYLIKIVGEKNIILIKGNHDTLDYSPQGLMKDFHKEDSIAFVHGDKQVIEIFDKNIKTIVMGHIHPSFILKKAAKKEAYKCFLKGKYKNKEIIIMPSFLGFVEGTPVNYYYEDYIESFSIIPKKSIMNFNIYAIGENEIFDFGKIKDL